MRQRGIREQLPPAPATLQVNGEDWPSALLPPQNAKIEAILDERPPIPWLDQADPLVSLHHIAFDPASNELNSELSSPLPGVQLIHLSLPAGWTIQSLQVDGVDTPVGPGREALG